jgi:hypothetical protein
MASANVTTDHDRIRKWVEERGGHPAHVKSTSTGRDDPGLLRVDFPGFRGAGTLEAISWDTWFEGFERNGLAFLFEERTANGRLSRFSKLVARETAEARERGEKTSVHHPKHPEQPHRAPRPGGRGAIARTIAPDGEARYERGHLLALLSERHAFEVAAVPLYEMILARVRRARDPEITRLALKLAQHRDQEREHRDWTESVIRSFGATPQASPELAELVRREARGIEQVIADDREIAHLFHALLGAELMDHAGWSLLLELAKNAGDRRAIPELERRRDEEEQHLAFAREVVASLTRRVVLLDGKIAHTH